MAADVYHPRGTDSNLGSGCSCAWNQWGGICACSCCSYGVFSYDGCRAISRDSTYGHHQAAGVAMRFQISNISYGADGYSFIYHFSNEEPSGFGCVGGD